MERRDLTRRQMVAWVGAATVLSAAPTPSSDASEYPLYKARGTHRELGRQHAEQASRQIKAHVEMLRARPKLSDEKFKRRVAKFQPMFERYCPHLLEEMRGLAEGAGVPLEEAMACSIRAELGSAPAEGCTAYAIGRSGAAGRKVIAGQNADMGSQMMPRHTFYTFSPGINPKSSSGHLEGCSAPRHEQRRRGAFFKRPERRTLNQFGMPEYVYERLMLECAGTEQVIDVLRKLPLASNENSLISDSPGTRQHRRCRGDDRRY